MCAHLGLCQHQGARGQCSPSFSSLNAPSTLAASSQSTTLARVDSSNGVPTTQARCVFRVVATIMELLNSHTHALRDHSFVLQRAGGLHSLDSPPARRVTTALPLAAPPYFSDLAKFPPARLWRNTHGGRGRRDDSTKHTTLSRRSPCTRPFVRHGNENVATPR